MYVAFEAFAVRLSFPNSLSSFLCVFWGSRSTSRARRVTPVAWRDVVFLFRSIACLLSTEGPSRSLRESPRARERAVDVLLESTSLDRI